MLGIVNGTKWLDVFSTYLRLGKTSWKDCLIEFLTSSIHELIGTIFEGSGVMRARAEIVITGAPGSKVFGFDPAGGGHKAVVNEDLAEWTALTTGMGSVPYTEGVDNYIGVCIASYPDTFGQSDDGTMGVKHWAVDLGEVLTPSSVVDNGDGTMQIVLPLPAWTKASGSRQIVAWKYVPETVSSEASYSGTAVLDGADVVVNVTHAFGQSSVSTTPADYRVFVRGPVVRLSAISTPVVAKIAKIEAAGTISYADQVVLPDLYFAARSILNVIEGAGLTFDPTIYTQLLDAVKGAFAAVGSLTDTTLTDTYFSRGLFSAGNCRVTGERSAAVGSRNVTITGARSVAIGCGEAGAPTGQGSITGDDSVMIGAYGSTIEGSRSTAFGDNVNLFTSNAIAGGLGGAPPGATGANANLQWILHKLTGYLHLQNLKVGGNANTGAGPYVEITAAGAVTAPGDITGGDLKLAADKTITRTVAISSARPYPHANPWELAEPTVAQGLAWSPGAVGAGTAKLIVSLPLTGGRKLVKVTVDVSMDGADTGTVSGNLYKKTDGSAPVALRATAVTWVAGNQGPKDVTPDAGDVTIDTGYHYYLVLEVDSGSPISLPGSCGCDRITVTEKLSAIG